jgi:hypothetical protein
MPATKVSGGLRFSVGPNPSNTAEVTIELIANGNSTCVPNFGEFQRKAGSGDWVNTENAVNIVTFSHEGGLPFYVIHTSPVIANADDAGA